MPKTKTSLIVLVSGWLKNLPAKKYFRQDGDAIFCEACLKLYKFKKISDLHQHIGAQSHTRAVLRFDARPERQQLINELPAQQRVKFLEELTEAMVAADIPWTKLCNPKLKTFLETYTGKNVPDESTLRKTYLRPLYNKAIESIRADVGKSMVWIAVDETIDAAGRAVANVIVGALQKEKPTAAHLLMCRELEKTNNSTITQLVLDSFGMLWPGETQSYIESKFVLFLTDGVPYMIKAGKNLKRTYNKLLHITCLAHAINLVGEEVRSHHQKTDTLIGALKAVFRKAPARIHKLKMMYPEIPLPPKPVLTRWGTWLDAVEYYCTNFTKIKAVLDTFLPDDAKCIETAQGLMRNKHTVTELSYISTNFGFLKITIKQLQEAGMSIFKTLEILDSASKNLETARGNVARLVQQKLVTVLGKNPDLQAVRVASMILNGDTSQTTEGMALNSFDPDRIACLMYAPLTTVIPERSFSISKAILTERRRGFTMQNFEMTLVSHFELCITDAEMI